MYLIALFVLAMCGDFCYKAVKLYKARKALAYIPKLHWTTFTWYETTNQISLSRSRDWLLANQRRIFPGMKLLNFINY